MPNENWTRGERQISSISYSLNVFSVISRFWHKIEMEFCVILSTEKLSLNLFCGSCAHLVINYFMTGGPYHIETSPLICIANQWIGFYMIGTSVRKKLMAEKKSSSQRYTYPADIYLVKVNN